MPAQSGILGTIGPIAIGIVVIAAIALAALLILRRPRRRASGHKRPHPSEQIAAVRAAQLKPMRLFTVTERNWLAIIDAAAEAAEQGHRVFAHVALSRLVGTASEASNSHLSKSAHSAIRTKRVDYVIVDRAGDVCAAIKISSHGNMDEIQTLRSAVTCEALRGAGIPVVEIMDDDNEEHVAMRLFEILTGDSQQSVAAE